MEVEALSLQGTASGVFGGGAPSVLEHSPVGPRRDDRKTKNLKMCCTQSSMLTRLQCTVGSGSVPKSTGSAEPMTFDRAPANSWVVSEVMDGEHICRHRRFNN